LKDGVQWFQAISLDRPLVLPPMQLDQRAVFCALTLVERISKVGNVFETRVRREFLSFMEDFPKNGEDTHLPTGQW